MRGVSTAGKGRYQVKPAPPATNFVVHTGQSLATGQQQPTPASTTQPYDNRKIFDSSGKAASRSKRCRPEPWSNNCWITLAEAMWDG